MRGKVMKMVVKYWFRTAHTENTDLVSVRCEWQMHSLKAASWAKKLKGEIK
jgi:hypothetical protein